MRKALFTIALSVVCSLAATQAKAASFTLTIPQPSSGNFSLYGSGDASVTLQDSGGNNVVFSQSSPLGNGNFFDVGTGYTGGAAELTSQAETSGVANIEITLPFFVTSFSLDYGSYDGSAVTFLLSNGYSTTESVGASGYGVPNTFSVGPTTPFDTVLLTAPGDGVEINNLSYNSTSVTPEPGTLSLLGTGLVMVGGFVRRKIRA